MGRQWQRFGFAAAALGLLALMGGLAGLKTLSPAGGSARPAGGGGGGGAPTVEAGRVALAAFADEVQALGTAQAVESVIITSKVTDTIRALRFESGQRVAKGQVLVELDSVEQQADLAEARAQAQADAREQARFSELFGQGFATKAALEAAQAAAGRSDARVEALTARIADRTLRAPIAGVLGLRNASVGQLVQPGTPIVTLDDVRQIKLDFDVPEAHLAQMKPGLALRAETAAYPQRVFAGRVDQIDSRVDVRTRAVRARAVLENGDGALKPGMLLTVRLQTNAVQALSVPETAVLERADGALVFRLEPQGQQWLAALVPVQTGRREGGRVEIMSGLAAGDFIILEGVNRARAGQTVRIAGPKRQDQASVRAVPTAKAP